MAQALTKPQVAMLSRAMRSSQALSGPAYRVAGRLSALGLGEIRDHLFYVNVRGLEVLRDFRSRRYAACGCIAYLEQLQEVERAIATEQVQP